MEGLHICLRTGGISDCTVVGTRDTTRRSSALRKGMKWGLFNNRENGEQVTWAAREGYR